MSTHAYGPWQVHAPAPQRTFVVRRNEREAVFIIAELWNNGQDEQVVIANARLMAAAPEMLEALKWIAEMAGYATYELKPEWRSKNGGDFDDALSQARAAIAQAEGEHPPGRTK